MPLFWLFVGDAAFFDLDRTLLRGGTGPLIGEALHAVGLLRQASIPGAAAFFKFYEHFGETLPAMLLARRTGDMVSGWAEETVAAAAELAAERIFPEVHPYAHALIADHRKRGRLVVLATSTPRAFVEPLASLLGFDEVVATDLEAVDGAFTGGLQGSMVWFAGKLAAIRSFAEARGVSLRESYAYSDSVYDLPMLMAVGHPVAVNPDLRLRAVATLRRWPIQHLDVPEGVPKFAGLEPYDVLAQIIRPELMRFARYEFSGLENLPADGGVIVCSNHRSYFDPLALGMALRKGGRNVRFMAKKEVVDAPLVGDLAKAVGSIRVDRGTGSTQPLEDAQIALVAGEAVGIFPEGTIPRKGEPSLVGKKGAARLAAATGVPVIPVGLMGTELVWPRDSKLPRVANLTEPPTVSVKVGQPVRLSHRSFERDTQRIMKAIAEQL